MPSWRPIQSGATSFLSLLGLKNNAKLPEFLLDEVRPTMDMQGWYLRDQAVGRSDAGLAISLAGTGVNLFTVPANEWWFIHSLWGQVEHNGAPTAADVFGLRVGVLSPPPYVRTFGPILPDIHTADFGARFYVTPGSLNNVWAAPGSICTLTADYINIEQGGVSIATARAGVYYTPLVA